MTGQQDGVTNVTDCEAYPGRWRSAPAHFYDH
jgi:hypothetical protein